MWRFESVHARGESEYLDAALERIARDEHLRNRADALLHAAIAQEPLVSDAMRTPQAAPRHAEGPFVAHHVRSTLMALYALSEEKLHLIDIEELRRMKGYEGEVDEIEETIKENIGFFEVFAIAHDVGKWPTATFSAPEGSRGRANGFAMEAEDLSRDTHVSDRAILRKRYSDLYRAFAQEHPMKLPQDINREFYDAYRIDVTYPGHARTMHAPVYRKLIHRIAHAHGLPARDVELLVDIIVHHSEPVADFDAIHPKRVGKYAKLARMRGFDGDDFIDLLQGALFLGHVCGRMKEGTHGPWHDIAPLVGFLQSEYAYEPATREHKRAKRERKRQERVNALFRKVGLDGDAVMKLLDLDPGPKLGKALSVIQDAALGRRRLPRIRPEIDRELEQRTARFREEWFDKEAC